MKNIDNNDSWDLHKEFRKSIKERQALINHYKSLGALITYKNLSGIGLVNQFTKAIPPSTIRQMITDMDRIKNLSSNIQPIVSVVGYINKMGIDVTPSMITGAMQVAKTSSIINKIFKESPITQIAQDIIDTSPTMTGLLDTPDVAKNTWTNIDKIKTDILLEESKKLQKKDIKQKANVLIVDGNKIIRGKLDEDVEQFLQECGFDDCAKNPIFIVKSLNNLIISIKDKEIYKSKSSLITLGQEFFISFAVDFLKRLVGLLKIKIRSLF